MTPYIADNGNETPFLPGRVAPPVTAQPQGWGNFSKFVAPDYTPSLNEWAGDVSAMVSDSFHSLIITRTKV